MKDPKLMPGPGSPVMSRRAPVGRAARRLFPSMLLREAAEAPQQRARVVPLPLAVAAVMAPFLCAWAVGAEDPVPLDLALVKPDGERSALDVLGRERRVPAEGEFYVDIHGAPEAWERQALRRQGYVAPR